jgi:hypothetical protein
MADIKISDLNEMISLSASTLLPVVDTVANQTKKVYFNNLEYSLGLFTIVSYNSASWNSGGSISSTIIANSATWNNGYANLTTLTAGHTLLTVTSSKWDSTSTTVATNSTGWASTYIQVINSSPAWNSSYTNLNTNSADWENTYTTVNSNSSSWAGSSSLANILNYLSGNTITLKSAVILNDLSAAEISSNNPSNSAVIADNNTATGKGSNTLHVSFDNGVYFTTPIISASSSNLFLSAATITNSLSVNGPLYCKDLVSTALNISLSSATITNSLSVNGPLYCKDLVSTALNISLSSATITSFLSVNGPVYCNDLVSSSLNITLSNARIYNNLTVNNTISAHQFLTDILRIGTNSVPLSVVTFPSTTLSVTSAFAANINGRLVKIPFFI